jgi:hypothetical protein
LGHGGLLFEVLKRRWRAIKALIKYYKYPKGLRRSRIIIVRIIGGKFVFA